MHCYGYITPTRESKNISEDNVKTIMIIVQLYFILIYLLNMTHEKKSKDK